MITIKNIFLGGLFSPEDRKAIMSAVAGKKRVVFIDTPATEHLLALAQELKEQKIEVVIRDHHDFSAPASEREQQIASAAEKLRALVGSNATISTRDESAACSLLVREGEFVDSETTAIVADPAGADGLLASLKGIGISYPELDKDAVVLDGPRSEQKPERLSPLGNLLVKGLATLPPYNPKDPAGSEKPKQELFEAFAATIQGDPKARASLEARVKAYETTVSVAKELISKATKPAPKVVLVDTVGSARFDLATLTAGIEVNVAITVIRKDSGPIAAEHGGVQYSLAVTKKFQQEVNLQNFLPKGFESSPKAGIISNTTFLLHVSEKVWKEIILPALTTGPCTCGFKGGPDGVHPRTPNCG